MTMTFVMSMIYPSVLFFGCLVNMYMVHDTITPVFLFSRTERTLDNFYAITRQIRLVS